MPFVLPTVVKHAGDSLIIYFKDTYLVPLLCNKVAFVYKKGRIKDKCRFLLCIKSVQFAAENLLLVSKLSLVNIK